MGLIQQSATSKGTDDGFMFSSSPLQSFNFWLLVEGTISVPLKSVRSFQKTNQYEKIKEGGLNDYVTLKRSPIQEPHQLVVERYMMSTLLDPLANGAELTLPLVLGIDHGSKKAGAASDSSTDSARLYVFTGCTVMSKEYGELNSEKSGLATEVITIGYKMMHIVPNLFSMGGDPSKSHNETSEAYSSSAIAADRQAKEEQKTNAANEKKKQLDDLKKWQQIRDKENRGELDPKDYGATVTEKADGTKNVEWVKKAPPKESDYFETDNNGNLKKDSKGNPIPKGSNANEKAKNKAAYEKKKAEVDKYNKNLDDMKNRYDSQAEYIKDHPIVKPKSTATSNNKVPIYKAEIDKGLAKIQKALGLKK